MRHRFAEDSLAAAVARGTARWWCSAPAWTPSPTATLARTRVFEVDHPATGAWKREQLVEVGIEVPDEVQFVAVDFERDSLAERLVEAGFDAARPAFFLWLGVVPTCPMTRSGPRWPWSRRS